MIFSTECTIRMVEGDFVRSAAMERSWDVKFCGVYWSYKFHCYLSAIQIYVNFR